MPDRATWHNYREPGYYMLTFEAEERDKRPFGTLVGDSEEHAEVILSPLGEALKTEIESQPRRHPELRLLTYVIMPDHCHICLHVMDYLAEHLGQIVWGIKYGTTVCYLNILSAQTGRTCRVESNRPSRFVGDDILYVRPLWPQRYHDRIVMHEGQVAALTRYIRRNPARLWVKQHGDRALTAVRDLFLPLTFPEAQQLKAFAIYCDEHRGGRPLSPYAATTGKAYATSYVDLLGKVLRSIRVGSTDSTPSSSESSSPSITPSSITPPAPSPRQPGLRLRSCGNRDLLQCGRPLVSVRISRSVTALQFEAELERLLSQCEREGAVLVSPFISWSEKVVLRYVRHHHYPHIVIDSGEMGPYFKPMDGIRDIVEQQLPAWWPGSRLQAELQHLDERSDLDCVIQGELLLLHPWPDRPVSDKLTKADMELMNALSNTLSLRLPTPPWITY